MNICFVIFNVIQNMILWKNSLTLKSFILFALYTYATCEKHHHNKAIYESKDHEKYDNEDIKKLFEVHKKEKR